MVKLLYRVCMYCDHGELSWISDFQSIISTHKTGRLTLALDHSVNTRAIFSWHTPSTFCNTKIHGWGFMRQHADVLSMILLCAHPCSHSGWQTLSLECKWRVEWAGLTPCCHFGMHTTATPSLLRCSFCTRSVSVKITSPCWGTTMSDTPNPPPPFPPFSPAPLHLQTNGPFTTAPGHTYAHLYLGWSSWKSQKHT